MRGYIHEIQGFPEEVTIKLRSVVNGVNSKEEII